jgi:RNA polymerase sigma-70 factor (ECF subfamily)
MDLEPLLHRAQAGDVKAFVELTRGYQHLAFGSALALVHDLQQAEDIVQEAFLAAWSALPKLAEPAAFPAWLRGIVRHQAYRVLRRPHLEAVPLDEASEVASGAPTPERRLEQRREAASALAAIAGLPAPLREPATLYYVHECSHQDIALFLGIPATTVNNRLHRARSLLQEQEIADPEVIALVAEAAGEVIGFAMTVPSQHELRAVYVKPNLIGGVGRALYIIAGGFLGLLLASVYVHTNFVP